MTCVKALLNTRTFPIEKLVQSLKCLIETYEDSSRLTQLMSMMDRMISRPEMQVFCLQNIKMDWMDNSNFNSWWRCLEKQFHILDTFSFQGSASSPGPTRDPSVHLLIRRDGQLRVLPEESESARKLAQSATFFAEFESELRHSMPGCSDAACTVQLDLVRKIMASRVALAVCEMDSDGHPQQRNLVLVSTAVSDVQGEASRAFATALHSLARRVSAGRLIAGLDAHTAELTCAEARGGWRADQALFSDHLRNEGITHCFDDDTKHTEASKVYTVRKARTFLEARLQKAGNIESFLRDWVLAAPSNEVYARGVRINKFSP